MKNLLVLLFSMGAPVLFAQDRMNAPNIIYPQELYYHNGGRVIDVTKPPFNAAGDGITDDTKPIIAAYNFIADVHRSVNRWQDVDKSYILYFPAGEYLVSSTLIYDGPRLEYGEMREKGIFQIRFVGQNRNNTIIKLKDNCDGFNSRRKKYLLCLHYPGEGTNIPGRNEIRNLTINTGTGNSGVAAIYYLSANTGIISDVTVISPDGGGRYGIEFPGFSVQGYFSDITIDGFDTGIYVNSTIENNPTIEYVTLKNQSKAGIQSYDGCPCLRKIESINSCSAVKLTGGGTQTVILDSKLTGVGASDPAIVIGHSNAQLFARNVSTEGYTGAIRDHSNHTINGSISEYFSHSYLRLNGNTVQPTINYPVKESPVYTWPDDPSQWVLVDTCQGTSVYRKLRNAMKSGKAVIWFGVNHMYGLSGSIAVPAHVTHIMGVYSDIDFHFEFRIDQTSAQPLYLYNLFDRIKISQNAPRAVVYKHGSGTYENRRSSVVTAYFESVANMGFGDLFCPAHTKIYARALNDEIKTTSNFKVFGGVLWVLGHKTEGPTASFDIRNGGICEVLGGYRNETGSDQGIAAVINDNSNVTYIGHTGMCSWYEYAIEETWDESTERLSNSELPVRTSQCVTHKDRHAAVYNRYDPAVAVKDADRETINHHFELYPNYPNPFNPGTKICYELPEPADVIIDVFDTRGRKTITLVNARNRAGYHAVVWDGRNTTGENVASGLYFYRIVSGEFYAVKKMTILR